MRKCMDSIVTKGEPVRLSCWEHNIDVNYLKENGWIEGFGSQFDFLFNFYYAPVNPYDKFRLHVWLAANQEYVKEVLAYEQWRAGSNVRHLAIHG